MYAWLTGSRRLPGKKALLILKQWRVIMPGKKHVRGVGDKEQRQYEHIKEAAQKSGRYGKRAEEVAARTVLKQHKEKGHKKDH
ncbi:MAG: hypothetical protein DMF70_03975 [Acidobacteria bacterium]|nr:MAG: hypothetical protein DMF70_03975 [Acidobacteriota bacterium]